MADEDYRQRTKGRFGIRTNKTLKYNRSEAWTRRKENLDSIVVFDKEEDRNKDGRQLVGISLNARKNWEIIENLNNNNNDRNSLRASQDDVDVDYGPRIVVVEDQSNRKQSSRKEDYRHQVHGAKEEEKEPEPELINGTNRKGFFVKEKRRKGKKGILKPEVQGTRNRSKSFNNQSDESDSDSAIDGPGERDNRVIVVSIKPKHPDYTRHEKDYCKCPVCSGEWDKNPTVVQRREIMRDISDL